MTSITPLKDVRIYLIDDSKAFSQGIINILEQHKCKIKNFLDPELAVEVIFQEPPDIIITDLEMPKLNGAELIKAIRHEKELSFIPILMMTSKDDPETFVHSIEVGADAFMSKNSVQQVLVANIIALLRIAELKKETIKVQQFNAVKTLIGTYKHEFGNTIAILDGKIHKLGKEFPDVSKHDAFKSVTNCIVRLTETLEKLNALREYQEEKYSSNSNIVKI